MEILVKRRPFSYEGADRICAYSGEEIDDEDDDGLTFNTVEPDNTSTSSISAEYVSFEQYSYNMKLHEAHLEAVNNVGVTTAAGLVMGGPKGAGVGLVGGVFTECYNSCHNQSPPKSP